MRGHARSAASSLPIDGRDRDRGRRRRSRTARGRREDRRRRRAEFDLAVDPLEGAGDRRARRERRDVDDRGRRARIAADASGHVHAQDGRRARVARGKIDLRRPVGENIEAIAEAFGRRVGDITTIVLDRPRHHDLIEEIRAAGARIKLIQDGDVTASISAAIRGTNDHLAIGIGGTRQAVLAAAALRCLGGELQAQLWPTLAPRDRARRASTGSRTSSGSSRSTSSRPSEVDRRARPASRTAISCVACATWPTARGRTRSSCARAATGCASSTASTSSPASGARRFGSSASRGTPQSMAMRDDVVEALPPGRGSRARDGHRRARAPLRRRGRRAEGEGHLQPHLDGLPGRPDDRGADPRWSVRRCPASRRSRPS